MTIGDFQIEETVRDVVNDGLMALFFLVIGLEVKRELAVGELSTAKAALLPVVAAVGGMVVPALVFLAVIGGGEGARGWGIPMATDVAFALGALAALGRRVPTGLVAFLLGVAVIDDIGAILVIAIYYTESLAFGWLAAAVCGLSPSRRSSACTCATWCPYVVLGLAVWFCMLESGVHPTIAGVAIGLLTPVRPFQDPAAVSAEAMRIARETADEPDDPGRGRRALAAPGVAVARGHLPLTRVENNLHEWSSFVVLPIFALANAGIVLDASLARGRHRDAHRAGRGPGAGCSGRRSGLTRGRRGLADRLGLGIGDPPTSTRPNRHPRGGRGGGPRRRRWASAPLAGIGLAPCGRSATPGPKSPTRPRESHPRDHRERPIGERGGRILGSARRSWRRLAEPRPRLEAVVATTSRRRPAGCSTPWSAPSVGPRRRPVSRGRPQAPSCPSTTSRNRWKLGFFSRPSR